MPYCHMFPEEFHSNIINRKSILFYADAEIQKKQLHESEGKAGRFKEQTAEKLSAADSYNC